MGVKNLWDILESCKKTLPLHHLQNKRVCIDLSCWMVQLQNVSKSHNCMREKVYLRGLFHRLRALIALNCTLIFVSDGAIPAIKLSTYHRRLNSGNEAYQEEKNSQMVSSLRRNTGSEFSRMIKEAKMLGLALGIPCLDGIEEAEAQCALLNSESLCDGCFTSDSDIFLFGARTVYRDICLGDSGYVVCYEMEDIEKQLGFGRNSLIALALLLGSDYCGGVHGFGQESACQIVKSAGDEVILQKIASGGLPFLKKTKASMKQGRPPKPNDKEDSVDNELHVNDKKHSEQFSPVINAYMKPRWHSADSDVVRRVLAQHQLDRAKLHGICAQLFKWSPERTDDYILPKIAERDLRKFANLRSKSSALGLDLLLQQIPVKCPVSRIIKPRKVKGRECFEVSWEGFEGLETCTVPADLLASACPERIHQFEAEKKQQPDRKTRQRKPKSEPCVAEIDLKLQNIVLDIESGVNYSSVGRSRAIPLPGGPAIDKDESARETVVSRDLANSTWCPTGPSNSNIEFIDLLSPLAIRSKTVYRCGEVGKQHDIDVIELSESDDDNDGTSTSPEHERKARELRLFIAGIRNE